jgi:hypothetical protein
MGPIKSDVLIERRSLLRMLASIPLVGVLGARWVKGQETTSILSYLQSLAREDGGYAWPDDPQSTLTATFAVIRCNHLLGKEPLNKPELIHFIRNAYPEDAARQKNRPLHEFDYQQIQSLVWLNAPIDQFRASAEFWVRPSSYPKYYESNGDPVLQQEVGAILSRALLGIAPT